MSETEDAQRRAAMAKLTEILRAAAIETVGPRASAAEFEEALMALHAEIVTALQQESTGALPPPPGPPARGRKTRRSSNR